MSKKKLFEGKKNMIPGEEKQKIKSNRPCLFRSDYKKHLHQIQAWLYPKLTCYVCYIQLIIGEKRVSHSKNTDVDVLLALDIQKFLGLFESFAFLFAKKCHVQPRSGVSVVVTSSQRFD